MWLLPQVITMAKGSSALEQPARNHRWSSCRRRPAMQVRVTSMASSAISASCAAGLFDGPTSLPLSDHSDRVTARPVRIAETSAGELDDLVPEGLGCLGGDEVTGFGHDHQLRTGNGIRDQSPLRGPADQIQRANQYERRALDIGE